LNNARKHSRSETIEMNLKNVDGELHLEIRDFGCGFDVKATRTQGFGLLGMRERVRLLGGEFHLESEHNVGTRILVRLPIPAEVEGSETRAC
jgi:NarL family two-component system sensor histidine kinase YdfH